MKIGDFLSKDYDYVSYRVPLPEWNSRSLCDEETVYGHSAFAGQFQIREGKIISLDGDSYDASENVLWYKEWSKDDVKSGLTIVVGLE